MTTTTFQNGVTLTDEDWFNDVDFLVYDIFGDSTTTASAASRIALAFDSIRAGGTLSVSAGAVVGANLQVGGTLSVSAKATVAAVAVGGTMSLTGVAGSVATALPKAWVRFDGTATSVTSAAAFNISSITDKGTGNYNIIFSTPFSSANIAPIPSANIYNVKLTSVSAASVEITCLDLSGTAADASIVALAVFGSQ